MEANSSVYKIRVRDLRFGMYVSQLDRPWLETPYSIQGILIKDVEDILELERYCTFVYVDINKSEPHIAKKYTSALQEKIAIKEIIKTPPNIFYTES